MRKSLKIFLTLALLSFLLLTVVGAKSAESDENIVGSWYVQAEKDPLTDKMFIGMGAFDNQGRKGLIIRHNEGTNNLFVSGESLLRKGKVFYRFDKGEVQEDTWFTSEDKTTLFFPSNSSNMEGFVKKLIKAEKFIIGIYPEGQTRETYIFKLNGLAKALSPHLETFGWEDLEDTIEKEMEEAEE